MKFLGLAPPKIAAACHQVHELFVDARFEVKHLAIFDLADQMLVRVQSQLALMIDGQLFCLG